MNDGLRREIDRFLTEEQDPELVERVAIRVKDILTSEESIEYVATQKRMVTNLSPDAVVLTNRRFIVYTPKLLGRVSFRDHPWRDLADAQLSEGIIGATLSFRTINGESISVGFLPKTQARKLYGIAQEKEERVREERRRRELEDRRASAGGIVMQGGNPEKPTEATGEVDPVERLKKLKQMLDADLISSGEYEAKRAEIISKM